MFTRYELDIGILLTLLMM